MAYNHGVYQFGLFDGDTSATALKSGITPPLQAGSHKYGSLTASMENYLRWVWGEMHCPQAGRIPAPFWDWCGVSLRILLGELKGSPIDR